MKLSDNWINSAPLAFVPAACTAFITARVLLGDGLAFLVTLVLLAFAGVCYVRDRKPGRLNLLALAALYGFPIGVLAGAILLLGVKNGG